MRAAIVTRYGPPAVLRIVEIPAMVPRRGEVIVRQCATSVSAGDARIRGARIPRGFGLILRVVFGWNRPRQPVLGIAVAGVVARIGAGVTDLAPGDRVMGTTATAMGAHAEEVAIKANRLLPLPAGLSMAAAAALPFGALTALFFLRDRARVAAGDRVLVIGASGAVGAAMVQLAVLMGAKVTAVCSGPNAALVRGLGATRVIDYRTEDFRAMGERQDVIVDCVGKTTAPDARAALVPGGRLCLVVAPLVAILTAGWQSRRNGIRVLTGTGGEAPADLAALAGLVATGALSPLIGATFPFDQIAEAHTLCDSGRKIGNTVILFGEVAQTPA